MRLAKIALKIPQTRACVLQACAREVGYLAKACEKIEDELGKVLLVRTAAPRALVVELQDLDRIRQTLDELGPLLRGLANSNRNIDVNILIENLSLKDLRQRIRCDVKQSLISASDAPMQPSQHGNVDWF
jgi:hypothetical protein